MRPDSLRESVGPETDPDRAAGWAGAYLHVPFCTAVCPYCDFAVVAGRDDAIDRYTEAMVADVASDEPWRAIDAVFVGGGTPSHLPVGHLYRMLESLSTHHGLAPDAEVTLEANPEDWTPSYAADLVAAGFNRVSFGVQSFDAEVLGYLGRRHRPTDAADAVAAARSAGFRSISLDLIFGSPIESRASWNATVSQAIACEPDHVSTYGLTVERGTPLFRSVEEGAAAPDPDDQADKYEDATEQLAAAGLDRYEVSNHGKPGHACRYNLIAWAHGEYVAYGMGAHSHRDGTRAWRARRLDTYLERIESGQSAVQGEERLDDEARERERLMIGLRRSAGVQAGPLGEAWADSEVGRRFVDAGVTTIRDGRLLVLRPLLADAVARSILGDGAPTVHDAS